MSHQPTSLSRFAGMLFLAACLAGCSSGYVREQPRAKVVQPVAPSATTRTASRPVHERAAINAVSQVGIPYRYGGANPDGFDCSGLVYFAYGQAGRQVPRTTATLWKSLRPVSKQDLRVGDVLFFRIDGKVSHVGMYLGDRRFVHAPQSGKHVTVAALDAPFYREALIRAGRP